MIAQAFEMSHMNLHVDSASIQANETYWKIIFCDGLWCVWEHLHCLSMKNKAQRYWKAIALQMLSCLVIQSLSGLSLIAVKLFSTCYLFLVTLLCLSLLVYQYFSHLKLHYIALSSNWDSFIIAFVEFALLWASWKSVKLFLMSDVEFLWKSLCALDWVSSLLISYEIDWASNQTIN